MRRGAHSGGQRHCTAAFDRTPFRASHMIPRVMTIERAATSESAPHGGPLAGIRVLDLAGESGVFTGRQLAELGADVIRVEPPGGDDVRRRGPLIDGEEGPERSLYHQHFNAGKRAITLDIEHSEGAAMLRRLADRVDLLIETRAPGEMDALGIGFEALRNTNPALIYVAITPFGQQGPMRHYRANDLVSVASSGLMYLNGFPEQPPDGPGAEQAYHMGSVAATAAAMVALVGRDRDPAGRGCRVDISLQEATAMSTLQTANANSYSWHREVPPRRGMTGLGGGCSLFRCRDDRWVSFVIPPPFWDGFVAWTGERGIESPLAEPQWRELAFRTANGAAISAAVEQLATQYDRADLFHEGQRRHMLVMPVNDVDDLLADEQLRSRGFFVERDHPTLGRTLTDTGVPYRFSETPAGIERHAPLLGEHNDEVYAGLLGISGEALAALRESGVV